MLYRVLLTATLLLSAGLFAPQKVLGSCGDWLAHPMMNADDAAESAGQLAAQEGDPIPRRPCNGPGCRQSPLAPAPAPSAPPTEWRKIDLIGWYDHPAIVSLACERCDRDDFLCLSSGYDRGIDRPPRS